MIDLSSPNFILSLIMLTINHVLAFGHFGEVSSIFSFIFRVPAVKFRTVSGDRNLIYIQFKPEIESFFRNIIHFMTFWHISHFVFGWFLSHFSFHYQLVKMFCQPVTVAVKKMLYRIIWIVVKSNVAAFSKFWNFVEKQFYHHVQNVTKYQIGLTTEKTLITMKVWWFTYALSSIFFNM